MRILVVYDSIYGNTAKVATVICDSLSKYGQSDLKRVSEVTKDDLRGLDLLIIGSPTQGGRPTEPTQKFIGELSSEQLGVLKIALFDTRYDVNVQNIALRLLMKAIGYAANKMAKNIEQRAGRVVDEPRGFIVTGKEDSLQDGELERARYWAERLVLNRVDVVDSTQHE